MPIAVIPADRSKDIPRLAEINRRTFLQELHSSISYKPSADEGGHGLLAFFEYRLEGRWDQPHTEVFKAVDEEQGDILGFVIWQREYVNDTPPDRKSVPVVQRAPQPLPAFMNADFLVATGADVSELKNHMKDEDHFYVNSFAVDTDHQNQGIGKQVLEYCLQIADEAGRSTWLVAFPGSHSLDLRHGFVDVDHKDTDLNAWDGNKKRGYGIYRASAMVRRR
ncbi:acyl-CoA N-acyltransferase [Xylariaceae sp. FL1272]|nr:acyl-CoA N-acyltransferase [Xylariaceae sp. FL1272]